MPAQIYTLHGRPFTGSAVVEALLEEVGAPYSVMSSETDAKGGASPELLALNTLGQVPVLVLPSGRVMTESGAISLYLADLYPAAELAPALDSPDRARYLRWMVFMAANTYMAHLRFYNPARYSANPEHAAAIKRAAGDDLQRQFAILAEAIGHGPWFLGQTYSALDPYAAMVVAWAEDVPALFRSLPNLGDHFARVKARPKIGPIWRRHGMDF